MSGTVTGLVLLAALLHASWNAIIKVTGDRLATMALLSATAAIAAASVLPFVVAPARASWLILAFTLILHFGYKIFLVRAYALGDFAYVYPIARGLAPLILLPLSIYIAGDVLSGVAIASVTIIAGGIVALAFLHGTSPLENPKALFYAVGTGIFVAAYTFVDAIGARLAGTPHGYVLWLFALDAIPIVLIALYFRRGGAVTVFRKNWRQGAVAGVLSLISFWLVIWALTLGPIAPVSAVRETSVIFAALIGMIVLRERLGALRTAAACVVAAGIVLLQFA